MDERWLLTPVDPPPTADECRAFSDRVVRAGEHLLWTGGLATFRRDPYPPHELAFLLVHGGVPSGRWRAAQTCQEPMCVAPDHVTPRERIA